MRIATIAALANEMKWQQAAGRRRSGLKQPLGKYIRNSTLELEKWYKNSTIG